MTSTKKCPACDASLPPEAPEGLCPRCLLEAGLSQTTKVTGVSTTCPADGGAGDGSHSRDDGARPTEVPVDSPSVPTAPELDRLLPLLDVQELLGQGGMGAVYKARQSDLDRFVAVKILLPQRVGQDPGFAERFAREARALAKFDHPNIVTIYDSGQAGGLYYFVMEFVDGVNLRDAIRSGSLSPKEALAIVPQICEALQYAHDEGIVHRDIKPENILVTKKGQIKIADFGLAKILGGVRGDLALTGPQHVMGTLHYMAPEQIEHPLDVDHRADIYSIGVVFYEMLTGELPLGRFDPPSRKVHVDVQLDQVVLKTLAKEPGLRYQRASDVQTDVNALRKKVSSASGASRATRMASIVVLVALLAAVWMAVFWPWRQKDGAETGNRVEQSYALFEGAWDNTDTSTQSYPRFVLEERAGSVFVSLWGKTHPNDSLIARMEARPGSADRRLLFFDHQANHATYKFELTLLGDDQAKLACETHFTDQSGRGRRRFVELFKRTENQAP